MIAKTFETARDSLRVIKEYLNKHDYDPEVNESYWKLVNFVNLTEAFEKGEVKNELKRLSIL